jgi:hypothetical protein
MQRSVTTLAGLLTVLIAARGLAQTSGDSGVEFLSSQLNIDGLSAPGGDPGTLYALPVVPPAVDTSSPGLASPPPLAAPTSEVPGEAEVETPLTESPKAIEDLARTPVAPLSDFLGYRWSTESLQWIPGNQLGEFSIDWDHYVKEGINQGVDFGMGFHFLDGPDRSDMPARVYDFSVGYQYRNRLGPLGIDVSAAVLAASDFLGSVRKGILFPSHAVGFLTVRPQVDIVFGVDYLDRGDIKLLPVAGLILTPTPETRFELLFPRPRAVYQLTDTYRIYLSGELGGGSWDIERVGLLGNDLATYRDLRTCIGLEVAEKDGRRSAFEVGYLFDRRLEYTSGIGDTRLADAVMFRLLTTF